MEAPLPIPHCIQPYNSRILAFIDVKAKQGKGSDVNSNPSP